MAMKWPCNIFLKETKLPFLLTNPYFIYFYLGQKFNGWIYLEKENIFLITDQKDFNGAKKSFSYPVVSQEKFFQLLQKKKAIHLDENIAYRDNQKIKANTKAKITYLTPSYSLKNNQFPAIKKLFHQLEMSVIYSYGLIRENLSLKEINHEVRDYLFLKSSNLEDLQVNINFYQNQNQKFILNKNNSIVYSLWLKSDGVASHYHRSVFFNGSFKKLFATYREGEKILENIKKTIIQENTLSSSGKIINLDWAIFLKNIFQQENFILANNENIVFSSPNFYNIKLIHKKYPIVLFDVFLMDKKKILFLNAFNNKLLHFPW